ncbi:hypothetical protein BgiMline_019392 [Biomphalaria glabrata]|uniref:Uncharacterized protein n=1 Tax=Biomphalaria glabrata TaxID=6526 RepID=A0A2C9M4L0_BIOGL|nr:hypothetical protein BgiMline_032256 [Biomphalaria glabrata]
MFILAMLLHLPTLSTISEFTISSPFQSSDISKGNLVREAAKLCPIVFTLATDRLAALEHHRQRKALSTCLRTTTNGQHVGLYHMINVFTNEANLDEAGTDSKLFTTLDNVVQRRTLPISPSSLFLLVDGYHYVIGGTATIAIQGLTLFLTELVSTTGAGVFGTRSRSSYGLEKRGAFNTCSPRRMNSRWFLEFLRTGKLCQTHVVKVRFGIGR